MAGAGTKEGDEPTWHESLLGYCGGSEAGRVSIEESMRTLGRQVGIELDYGVKAQWQPVESQRALLWAGRFGKQELFMDEVGKRHFERRQSASHRSTLLQAATAVDGLDPKALDAFLDTDELEDFVWQSYRATIHDKGIHAIPFFSFGLPGDHTLFRKGGSQGGGHEGGGGGHEGLVVRGSANPETFCAIFESLLEQSGLLREENKTTTQTEAT
mmetsp:Transcript_37532/g.120423  ORF Transcript_37532/g.120423 Transcript_37532/m.120423 type:complete len:214 (-) Transcript_37532:485-1126(-)